MKIARESLKFIFSPMLIGLLFALLFEFFFTIRWLEYLILSLSVILAIFFLIFFRDPDREIPPEGLVSPADGVVKEIRKDGETLRIAVFMNIHNVHVNRAPISGRITDIRHVPGGYVPAFRKESERNERTYITMETPIGKVEIVQIAGVLVRRIVTYVRKGDTVEKGQRIGMIRFGSRVDTIMPADRVKVIIREGDRVKAGETVIALYK